MPVNSIYVLAPPNDLTYETFDRRKRDTALFIFIDCGLDYFTWMKESHIEIGT